MTFIIGALIVGYFIFVMIGVRLGYKTADVVKMSLDGTKKAVALMLILLLIGVLTGTWRSAGSIVIFVYYGIRVISPHMFLVITFLITCLLSYALGTSFGVAGTAGVIFMTLARSGGVDPTVAAGVVLSGIYFGDRTSPASSTAFTVASVTGTDLYTNVRNMLKTGLIPWLLCLGFYSFLSYRHPISGMDPKVMSAFEGSFKMSLLAFLPAVIILVFPLLKIDIIITLTSSILAASAVAVAVQGESIPALLRTMLLGYKAADASLSQILDGGGMVSMAGTVVIVAIACSYTGILEGTGLTGYMRRYIRKLTEKIGLFPTVLCITVCTAVVFCNQVVAIILDHDLMADFYEEKGLSKEDLAIDIENSAITIPALIPWCILISVPLAILGVTYAAVPYAMYIYAIPLVTLIEKGIRSRHLTMNRI